MLKSSMHSILHLVFCCHEDSIFLLVCICYYKGINTDTFQHFCMHFTALTNLYYFIASQIEKFQLFCCFSTIQAD